MRGLAWLGAGIFGRWRWQAPAWLGWAGARTARGRRYLVAHPARAAALAVIAVAAAGGYFWYATRPKPHYVTFTVSSPALTKYDDNGIAASR